MATALSIVLLQLVFMPSLSAQPMDQPYCATDDAYFPDGVIAKIKSRYFRVCAGPISVPQESNDYSSPRIRLDSRFQIENVLSDYPDEIFSPLIDIETSYTQAYQSVIGEVHQIQGDEDFVNDITDRQKKYEIGRVRFGDATYILAVRGAFVVSAQEKFASGSLPDYAVYLFVGPETLNLPEHFMRCEGDPTSEPRNDYNCSLFIRYILTDDIIVGDTFLWSPSFLSFPGIKPPFDMDNLPTQIGGMMHIVQQIDVTDEIDELREYIRVIEWKCIIDTPSNMQ